MVWWCMVLRRNDNTSIAANICIKVMPWPGDGALWTFPQKIGSLEMTR